MDYIRRIADETTRTADARAAAYRARADRARRWARLVLWAAAAVLLSAVWQDRALAPPLHDGMRVLAGRMGEALEGSEGLRRSLRQLISSPSATSVEPEFDPVTMWLLKWRN